MTSPFGPFADLALVQLGSTPRTVRHRLTAAGAPLRPHGRRPATPGEKAR